MLTGSLQRSRAAQIGSPAEAARSSCAWVRVPRVPHAAGGGGGVRCAPAHTLARPASGARVGRGGRAGHRGTPREGRRRVRQRERDARAEAQAANGWRWRRPNGGGMISLERLNALRDVTLLLYTWYMVQGEQPLCDVFVGRPVHRRSKSRLVLSSLGIEAFHMNGLPYMVLRANILE
jgi:hypothetical protein